jgi:hypothetical protein
VTVVMVVVLLLACRCIRAGAAATVKLQCNEHALWLCAPWYGWRFRSCCSSASIRSSSCHRDMQQRHNHTQPCGMHRCGYVSSLQSRRQCWRLLLLL